MKIAGIRASFPVFRLRSRISYQTPRRPTAIERMLLRLCTELATSREVGRMTVGTLFEEMLCVPDAAVLVAPCLEDLVVLGVVIVKDGQTRLDVPLADLTVTPRGQDMLARGRLPGKPTEVVIDHLFDPISRSVSTETKRGGASSTAPLDAHADPTPFEDIDPEPAVRAKLPADGHSWFTADTDLDQIQCEREATLWRERTVVVDADASGTVRISVPSDPAVESWLRGLDGELVWERFLAAALATDGDDDFPLISLEGLRAAGPVEELPVVLREGERAAVRFVVEPHEPSPSVPGKGAIVVVHQTGLSIPVIEWNAQRDGARVRLDFDPPEGLASWWLPAPGQAPVAWAVGRVWLTWSGTRYQSTIAVAADDARARALGDAFLATLADGLDRLADPIALALRARWQPVEGVLDAAFARCSGFAPRELIDWAAALRARIESISGSRVAQLSWEARMRPALMTSLRALAHGLSARELVVALGAVKESGLRDPAALIALIVDRAGVPADLASLRSLRTAVGSTMELPPRFFPPRIVRALVEDGFAVKPGEAGSSPIEDACRAARAVLDDLSAQLKVDPYKLGDDDARERTLPQVRRQTVDVLARWRVAVSAVKAAAGEAELLAGTRFVEIERTLAGYQAQLARLSDSGVGPGQPVVIDTNALIDFPDLLSRLGRDEVPVLPMRVLDELDRKQLDPAVERAVGRAIRAIKDAGPRVRYVEGDLSLLPRDFRSSSDNLILSVATKLRLRDPLLLTADVNLQNKALAQNLRAKAPRAFIDERTRQQPSPRRAR